MILQEWDPNQTLDEVDLSTVVFSVQIHGLPLEIVDVENARLIGSKLGVILEMDDVEAHHSFIRLKIKFHTSASLEPGFYFPRADGESVWIGFNYEWLSSFCFHCGLIDHTIGACYQNPPHPQNYALTDRMPGLPPLSSVGETRWGGAPPRPLSDDRWRSFQLGGHGRSSATILLGTTAAVDSTPVEDLNFSRQLGAKKKMESFFQTSPLR